MDQLNAVIRVDVSRLNFPTATIHARIGSEFVARFRGVPDDVTNAVLRVYNVGSGYNDINCHRCTNGDIFCRIPGACFLTTGSAHYELRADAASGNGTAISVGLIEVGAFSWDGTPVPPGPPVVITKVTDLAGNAHTLRAIQDDDGNWTTILED